MFDNLNMNKLKIKRVYEAPADDDGVRILVDRLWPRGMKKDEVDYDEWFKNLAPSTDLREWFNHDPSKFSEFSKKYKEELKGNPQIEKMKEWLKKSNVTLLYAAKDIKDNQAVVLKDYIDHLS